MVLRGTGGQLHAADPTNSPSRAERKAFVHKEYKNYIQLIHAESNDLCARSMSDSLQVGRTPPRRNLKVNE